MIREIIDKTPGQKKKLILFLRTILKKIDTIESGQVDFTNLRENGSSR